MTTVFQSSPIQKKTSKHLRLLVWTCPLTLSSISSLLSLLLRKYLPIQLRLTRNLPHLYDHLTISQLNSQTPLLLPQLDYSSHFRCLPTTDYSKTTKAFPPFSSFLSDVRPLPSRPNHLKLQPDHSVLGRQHRREYYTNHARRTKRPRVNQHLQYCVKPEFCKWEIVFWDCKRQEYTIQSTSLPSQRLVVPPQAITTLPR